MAEESSFQGLNLKNSLAVVGAVGMWQSRSDFQGGCETRRVLHLPSFPQPFRRLSQPLEEFGFGLLPERGSLVVAGRSSDGLENGDGESRASNGCGRGEGQQGLQRGLI